MFRINLIILFILSFALTSYSQDIDPVIAQLQNNDYGEKPDLVFYLLDKKGTKMPEAWVDQFNEWMKGGIRKASRFGKKKYYNPQEERISAAYKTPAHYVAKFEVFDISLNGEPLPEYLYSSKGEFTIAANFILLDLVKGTRVASETIIFSGTTEDPNGEEFQNKIGSHFQKAIVKKLQATFPTVLTIAGLGEVSKEKVKSLKFNKAEYHQAGAPKKLRVYILDKTIDDKGNDPIHTFKMIGYLKNKYKEEDNLYEYEVEGGKSKIYEYFNNGTPIYVTSLYLGK